MIIIRSPLRISLGGGGTDLPSYYNKHKGFVLSAAINKYVYLMILRPFEKGITLKYSQKERINSVKDIKHPIVRETFLHFQPKENQIEIVSQADIPSGTGLGSSGSFTTALVKGLAVYYEKFLTQKEIADIACDIEINKLSQPVGKQDQFAAAIGGINSFKFEKNKPVEVDSINISEKMRMNLEDRLLLFFTGFSRDASSVLQDQHTRTISNDNQMIENLHYVKKLGIESKDCLLNDNLYGFAKLMNDHWEYKKKRSKGMSNSKINNWFEEGIRNGALSGKLVGAGGGGFLMFLAEDKFRLRKRMNELGLTEVHFQFDYDGTKIINA